ncbi:MAG: DUF4340 domain-containing protein [Treponema sp.]|nr:DUF4340 domain-containing protein [Treponema sp.]
MDDLLAVLSRRDLYPLRSVSQEGRDRLGFAEGKSSRIVIRGGAGLPLLDLLIGTGDVLGRDVYLKRADQDEIYSGEDRFTIFTDSKPNAWYDLRLFPADNQSAPGRGGAAAPAASGAYSINAGQVQEAEISLPRSNGEGGAPAPQGTFVLRRDSRGWIIPGNEGAALDTTKVESWLRAVLEAEGEDFSSEAPAAVDGHITLRLGDGTVRTIQAGPADSDKRRNITVSGSKLVYVFSEWPFSRLFREQTYFLKAANR